MENNVPFYTAKLELMIAPSMKKVFKEVSKESGVTASEMVRHLILDKLESLGKTIEKEWYN